MIRKLFWWMKRKPVKEKICDTCGQVSSEMIDGLCYWCHKYYKVKK